MMPEPANDLAAPFEPVPAEYLHQLTPRIVLKAIAGYVAVFATVPFLLCLLPHS